MREILRITHGMQDERKEEILQDYELEVFEGDIIYIQGLEGSGVKTLISLLAGDCTLTGGDLYLWEEKVRDYDRNKAYQYGIYTITAEKDLVEELTVAENLEGVRYLPSAWKYYDRRKIEENVSDYLEKEQAHIPADICLWMLSKKERRKLSILKAKMHDAKIIVLDATGDIYEGREAEELCNLIRRANAEGITFIILSECYNMFAEIASRIQVVSQGRDLKEWTEVTDRIRQRLRHQVVSDAEYIGKNAKEEGSFLGLFDYEWEMKGCIWDYLSYVKEHNSEMWNQHIRADVPGRGCSQAGATVVIPRESAESLLKNMSIADNLIMAIPQRVSRNRIGVIKKSIRKNIARDFYKNMGIDSSIIYLEDLNRIQKKILSIYRLVLNRPGVIILESPYSGMNLEERENMRRYLRSLKKRGIRIMYFSRSMEELREDCHSVMITQNGESAKITTF